MAQRTAFLNSDAKGYNKDFHHTWIHNYLLHQVGVMFTDYNTKNEFKLGNGQISGGKAIIRCTRTTGNFAGSKILALFESTATESISTSGDKKVFIEIPEIYVNDSTAITDTLTQGLNLGVGVIKSEADYPSHTNYIPLWEITGGDWEQAVDVRPEILARGKPNTISYIDNNGVQRNMMLDASSLNKFLKSNGAGVAPSWADVGDVVEVSNLKNTFFAGEDLLPKSMFRMESELDTVDAVDESIRFGYDTDSAKVQLNTILSGEEGDYVKLNLEGFNTPADNVNVRIETVDSSGNATGTLINPDATATINPSGTLEEMSINLAGMIDGTTAGQKVAVVLSRSGALSTSNYYKVGVATADTGIWKVKTFDGTSWNLETGKKGYISSPLFMEEGAIQSKATTEFLAETTGYVEAGATAGNEFTGVRFGMVEHNGFKPGAKVFLTDIGELGDEAGSVEKMIGTCVRTGVVEIGVVGVGAGVVKGDEFFMEAGEDLVAGTAVISDEFFEKAVGMSIGMSKIHYTGVSDTFTSGSLVKRINTIYLNGGKYVITYESSGKTFGVVVNYDKDKKEYFVGNVIELSDATGLVVGGLNTGDSFFLLRRKSTTLYSKACSVSGLEITIGEEKIVHSNCSSPYGGEVLDENKFVAVFADRGNNKATTRITCTVDGLLNINVGSESSSFINYELTSIFSMKKYWDGYLLCLIELDKDGTKYKHLLIIYDDGTNDGIAIIDTNFKHAGMGNTQYVHSLVQQVGNGDSLYKNFFLIGKSSSCGFNVLQITHGGSINDDILGFDLPLMEGSILSRTLDFAVGGALGEYQPNAITSIGYRNKSLIARTYSYNLKTLQQRVFHEVIMDSNLIEVSIANNESEEQFTPIAFNTKDGKLYTAVILDNSTKYLGVTAHDAIKGERVKVVRRGMVLVGPSDYDGGKQLYLGVNGELSTKGFGTDSDVVVGITGPAGSGKIYLG